MSLVPELSPEKKLAFDRIIFFSDAVFAIAITLLALELRVPEMPSTQVATEMLRQLGHMTPKFIGFVLSFTVIGIFWHAHHQDFQYIKCWDRRLILINFLLLLFVAFLPFPTALLDTYPAQQITVSFYSGTVAALGMARWLMWQYATRGHRLVDQNLDEQFIARITRRTLITPTIFLLSIGIAFFNPTLAMLSWCLIAAALVVS
jgi:uncharacterized membrane protein